jgi:hypothetical protein
VLQPPRPSQCRLPPHLRSRARLEEIRRRTIDSNGRMGWGRRTPATSPGACVFARVSYVFLGYYCSILVPPDTYAYLENLPPSSLTSLQTYRHLFSPGEHPSPIVSSVGVRGPHCQTAKLAPKEKNTRQSTQACQVTHETYGSYRKITCAVLPRRLRGRRALTHLSMPPVFSALRCVVRLAREIWDSSPNHVNMMPLHRGQTGRGRRTGCNYYLII